MPYRPLTEPERQEVLAKIDIVKKELALRHQHLSNLEHIIVGGIWYSSLSEDDFETIKFMAEHDIVQFDLWQQESDLREQELSDAV